MAKKISSSFPKKRSTRPVCRSGDTFPCGFSCKNQYYKTKQGETRETQCKNLLKGQAKNFMSWQKTQAERLESINKKRDRVGLSAVKTTDAMMIDPKAQSRVRAQSPQPVATQAMAKPSEVSKGKFSPVTPGDLAEGDTVFFKVRKDSKQPTGGKLLSVDLAKGKAKIEYKQASTGKTVSAIRPVSELLMAQGSGGVKPSNPKQDVLDMLGVKNEAELKEKYPDLVSGKDLTQSSAWQKVLDTAKRAGVQHIGELKQKLKRDKDEIDLAFDRMVDAELGEIGLSDSAIQYLKQRMTLESIFNGDDSLVAEARAGLEDLFSKKAPKGQRSAPKKLSAEDIKERIRATIRLMSKDAIAQGSGGVKGEVKGQPTSRKPWEMTSEEYARENYQGLLDRAIKSEEKDIADGFGGNAFKAKAEKRLTELKSLQGKSYDDVVAKYRDIYPSGDIGYQLELEQIGAIQKAGKDGAGDIPSEIKKLIGGNSLSTGALDKAVMGLRQGGVKSAQLKAVDGDRQTASEEMKIDAVPAKYAKGKLATKNELAKEFGGKYSGREQAYIISPAGVEKMKKSVAISIKPLHERTLSEEIWNDRYGQRTLQEVKLAKAKYGKDWESYAKNIGLDLDLQNFERNKVRHKESVAKALSEGLFVPSNVLDDYPDLRQAKASDRQPNPTKPETADRQSPTKYQPSKATIETTGYKKFNSKGDRQFAIDFDDAPANISKAFLTAEKIAKDYPEAIPMVKKAIADEKARQAKLGKPDWQLTNKDGKPTDLSALGESGDQVSKVIERIKSGQPLLNYKDGYRIQSVGDGMFSLTDPNVSARDGGMSQKLTEKEVGEFLQKGSVSPKSVVGGDAGTEDRDRPKASKFRLSENQGISRQTGTGKTYYYLVDENNKTIDRKTLKPYKGNNRDRYAIHSKSEAEALLKKVNGENASSQPKDLDKTGHTSTGYTKFRDLPSVMSGNTTEYPLKMGKNGFQRVIGEDSENYYHISQGEFAQRSNPSVGVTVSSTPKDKMNERSKLFTPDTSVSVPSDRNNTSGDRINGKFIKGGINPNTNSEEALIRLDNGKEEWRSYSAVDSPIDRQTSKAKDPEPKPATKEPDKTQSEKAKESVEPSQPQAMQVNLFGGFDEIPVDSEREQKLAKQDRKDVEAAARKTENFKPFIKPKKPTKRKDETNAEYEQRLNRQLEESNQYMIDVAGRLKESLEFYTPKNKLNMSPEDGMKLLDSVVGAITQKFGNKGLPSIPENQSKAKNEIEEIAAIRENLLNKLPSPSKVKSMNITRKYTGRTEPINNAYLYGNDYVIFREPMSSGGSNLYTVFSMKDGVTRANGFGRLADAQAYLGGIFDGKSEALNMFARGNGMINGKDADRILLSAYGKSKIGVYVDGKYQEIEATEDGVRSLLNDAGIKTPKNKSILQIRADFKGGTTFADPPSFTKEAISSVDSGRKGIGITQTTRAFLAEQLIKLDALNYDGKLVKIRFPGGGEYEIPKNEWAINQFVKGFGIKVTPKKGDKTLEDALKRESDIIKNFSEYRISPHEIYLIAKANGALSFSQPRRSMLAVDPRIAKIKRRMAEHKQRMGAKR